MNYYYYYYYYIEILNNIGKLSYPEGDNVAMLSLELCLDFSKGCYGKALRFPLHLQSLQSYHLICFQHKHKSSSIYFFVNKNHKKKHLVSTSEEAPCC